MEYSSAIFIDTSVQILRFIGSRDIKAQVENQIRAHRFSVTSLVVRQEFKRRFLTDVRYVKNALEKNKLDPAETLRYVNRKLSSHVNRRKLSISLEILATAGFTSGEEFHLLLSSWEDFGLDLFDDSVGQVVRYSGCGCGMSRDLGPTKCRTARNCAINSFLSTRAPEANAIYESLLNCISPPKTSEISKAEQYLDRWLNQNILPEADDPCLKVGDLLIALESNGIPVFYTQNARESQFFCKVQNQTMVVHRPGCDEIRASSDRDNWPTYT